MSRILQITLSVVLLACITIGRAADSKSSGNSSGMDPSYRLLAGDTISITVFGEPDLTVSRTIGQGGEVRVQLLDEVILGGKTYREAESTIEKLYRERKFLKKPVVSVVVSQYVPREVSVLGAVRAPGNVAFPRDMTSLDIIDVITRAGGFLPISKSEAVTVTRRLPDGHETVSIVNLEDVIAGKRKAGRDRADVAIFPGDRIWVPERIF